MKKAIIAVLALALGISGSIVLLGACGGGGSGGSAAGPIVLVSQNTAGIAGSDDSESAGVSYDGRYVVFYSYAPNLVADDTSGDYDVFLRDVQDGITSRESVSSAGTQANNASFTYSPAISDDGRYIAFETESTNLFADTNGNTYDIVLRDTQDLITALASKSSSGTQGNNGSYYPAISGNGRYVAFQSDADNLVMDDTNNNRDIFLYDSQALLTTRVSLGVAGTQANDGSYEPSISSDGRYVAFQSNATNLVAGDTNGQFDVFVRDNQTNITSLVSVSTAGSQANGHCDPPAISGNGRYVAFPSDADNLVANDTNGTYDIFVRDIVMNETTRVSVSSTGTQANFGSYSPSISADGRFVAFESRADSLVSGDSNGDSDIFVHDRETNITARVSVSEAGTEVSGDSYLPYISGDGRYVVFDSNAANLVSTPADLGPPGTRHIYRAPVK